MYLKTLTSNGQAREVINKKNDGTYTRNDIMGKSSYIPQEINTTIGDDGLVVDVDKVQSYRLNIDYIKNKQSPLWNSTTFKNLPNIESTLIAGLFEDFNGNHKYLESTFDNFNTIHNSQSFKKFHEYAEMVKSKTSMKSAILYSNQIWGVGKTHLLHALAKYIYNSPLIKLESPKSFSVWLTYVGISYQLVREEDLLLRIRATYNRRSDDEHGEDESDIYKYYNRYDLLAIDDVGKYTPSNMDFYRRVMFQIIDSRYNNNQGVIISTNLNMNQLTTFLGEAIADRLNEMSKGYQLEFKGKSHRGLIDG